MAEENIHERAARLEKVGKLVDMLVRAKITHADALLATEQEWANAALAAGVNKPSAKTIEMVLERLKSMEKPL